MSDTLFDYAKRAHSREFGGATYNEARDGDRLKAQIGRVRTVMKQSGWITLESLAKQTGDPQASVSARLRDLRKTQFGGYTIERRYKDRGIWEYRLGMEAS